MPIIKDQETGAFLHMPEPPAANFVVDEESGARIHGLGRPAPVAASEPEKPEGSGLGWGVDALARGGLTSAGLMAKGVGFDETGGKLLKKAEQFPARIPTTSDIGGVGDAFVFAGETFLENAPNIAAVLAGTMGGGALAGAAGAGVTATRLAQALGAFSASFPLQKGESEVQQEQAGIPEDQQKTIIPAAIKASLDIIGPLVIARKLGLTPDVINAAVTKAGISSGLYKVGVGGGLILGEGATEATQEFVDQAAANLLKEGHIRWPDDQEKRELLEAGIKGMIGMSPFAVAAGFRAKRPATVGGEGQEPEALPQITGPEPMPALPAPPPTPLLPAPTATPGFVVDPSGVATPMPNAPVVEPGAVPGAAVAPVEPQVTPPPFAPPPTQGQPVPGIGANVVKDVPDLDPEFKQIAETPIPPETPPTEKARMEQSQTEAARAISGLNQAQRGVAQVARLYGPQGRTALFSLPGDIPVEAFFPTARQTGPNAQELYVPMSYPLVIRKDADFMLAQPSPEKMAKAVKDLASAKLLPFPYSHVVLAPSGPGSEMLASLTKGQDIVIPTAQNKLRPTLAGKAIPETEAGRQFHFLKNQLFPDIDEAPFTEPVVKEPGKYPVSGGLITYVDYPVPPPSILRFKVAKGFLYIADGKIETSYNPKAKVHVLMDPASFRVGTFTDPMQKAEWVYRIIEQLRSKFVSPESRYVIRLEKGDPNNPGQLGSAGFDVATQTTDIWINNERPEGPDGVQLHATLTHEFGHSLVWETFRHMPLAVRRGVMREYASWLGAVKEMTVEQFQLTYWDSVRLGRLDHLGPPETKIKDILDNPDNRYHIGAYLTSFHEWSAQMFSRAIERSPIYDPSLTPNLTKFFKALLERLRQLYSMFRKLGAEAEGWERTFQDYLKLASVRWKLGAPSPAPVGMQSFDQDPNAAETNFRLMDQVMKEGDLPHEEVQALNASLDKFSLLQKWAYTLLQVAEQNVHVQGLQRYVLAVQKFWSDKSAVTSDANDTIEQWNKLGKEQENRLAKFMFDLTMKSNDLGRRLTNEEKTALVKEHGLNEEAFKLYSRIDGDMQTMLQKMEAAAITDITAIFGSPTHPHAESMIRNIKSDFKKMRGQDYFPLTRFGQYGVLIRASANVTWNGKKFRKGDVMGFETYENKREQQKRAKQLRTTMKGTTIAETYLEDNAFAFQGFPPSMADYMKERLDMSDEQREEFKKILANMSPGQTFRKHLLRRRGVAGFSTDAKRAYASYMQHGANHLARIMNYKELTGAQAQVSADIRQINLEGGSSVTRAQIHQYMAEHYRYLMNPGNELASLRAATFLWYLGFNVKSAFVNLTQLPIVGYSYFASRYGDARAMKEMTKAMKDTLAGVRREGVLSEDELNLLERGREAGFIDESFASDLAGTAEGGNLSRLFATTPVGRQIRRFSEYGAFMFHSVETFMRRAAFLTAIRLARADGLTLDQQFDAGRAAVQKTMFEYARWNKPKMMQGKRSIFFVFMQYLQHALYFAAHDKGRARFLMTMLVLAGMQGLPGAEDLLDGLDWGATWLKSMLGMENPRTDLRFEARKLINAVGADPDLILHGLSRKSFGLNYLGMPELDVSGSLSLGRVVPGFGPLTQSALRGQSLDTIVSKSGADAAGATIGVGMGLLQAISSNAPDEWKKWESALPSALRNASRATRWALRGEETNNLGDRLITFDPDDTKEMIEIAAGFFGFGSTRLAEKRELISRQRDIGQYYMLRRQVLTAQYFHARKANDREAIADVMEAVKRFNTQAPTQQLKITSLDLARSFRQRLRNQQMRESGRAPVRRLDSLYQELAEEYQ